MMKEKYETLPLTTLKELAKARGLKGISTMKKAQVIELMLQEDEKEQEKESSSAQSRETRRKRCSFSVSFCAAYCAVRRERMVAIPPPESVIHKVQRGRQR